MRLTQPFRFCPNCKNPLTHLGVRLINCKKCGFHFYFSSYLVNAAILENKNGEILLVKRAYDPKKGWWDLPGGFMEPGETLEESIKREALEELNVEIDNVRYLTSTADHYLYKNIDYPTTGFTVTAKIIKGLLTPKDDVAGIGFFKKDKIPFSRIAFKSLVKAIKIYINRRV